MTKKDAVLVRRKFKLVILCSVIVLLIGLIVLLWCLPEDDAPQVEPPEQTEPVDIRYYSESAFYKATDRLYYSDGECRTGIDVSDHQQIIDWESVAADGIEFAVLRIGGRGYGTEGNLFEDGCFERNIREAQQAGIAVSVYFFSQATTVEEAEEEAAFTLELLEGYSIPLPIFYDWEHIEDNGRTSDLSAFPITDFAVAFCDIIRAAGYEAGVYFNLTYAYHYLDMERLQDYTLWLAEYNTPPTYPDRFDWIQYSDGGTVDGVEGEVDLDLMIIPTITSTDFVIDNDE